MLNKAQCMPAKCGRSAPTPSATRADAYTRLGMPRSEMFSTGWYYRVQPGRILPGNALQLVERPQPDWP